MSPSASPHRTWHRLPIPTSPRLAFTIVKLSSDKLRRLPRADQAGVISFRRIAGYRPAVPQIVAQKRDESVTPSPSFLVRYSARVLRNKGKAVVVTSPRGKPRHTVTTPDRREGIMQLRTIPRHLMPVIGGVALAGAGLLQAVPGAHA